jgi:hypothetical protein
MNYVDDLAEAIRRAVPAQLLPDGDVDDLFRIYAVLAMAKGQSVALEDVHDAWSAWMSRHQPAHPSLKPLAQLPPDIRQADEPYLDAIRTVARKRGVGGHWNASG